MNGRYHSESRYHRKDNLNCQEDTCRHNKSLPYLVPSLDLTSTGSESHGRMEDHRSSIETKKIIVRASLPTLVQNVSQQRALDEFEQTKEEADDEHEESLHQCFYVADSNYACFKSNAQYKGVTLSFEDAPEIPEWAEAIDKDFDALEARGSWDYVDRHPTWYILMYAHMEISSQGISCRSAGDYARGRRTRVLPLA